MEGLAIDSRGAGPSTGGAGPPPAARWPVRLRLRIPGASPATRAELATVLGSLGATREAATILEEVAGQVPDAAARRMRSASARLRARDN